MTISPYTAVALYILAVTFWLVLCASVASHFERKRRKAAYENAEKLAAIIFAHREFEVLDRQPSEDEGERDMYGRRLQ